MKMKNIFQGYVEIEAPVDDTERAKWQGIDWSMPSAVPGGRVFTIDEIRVNNQEINRQIAYRSDPSDSWQSPLTTMRTGQGDCEDYAILKMARLRIIGVPRWDMALVLGTLPEGPHAFLVVEIDGRRWVLDNKFDQLIEPQDYINFQPKKMLCDEGAFLYSKAFTIKEKAPPSSEA